MSVVTHHGSLRAEPRRQRHPVGRRVRRLSLGIFFGSVAVNAAIGIYAVLTPTFGETQSKILATSLCVTGAVVVALACEPAWERGLLGPVPYAGAGLGSSAFVLTAIAVWSEIDSEVYGKSVGTIMTAAAACTIASLLALARLTPGHEWVFRAALGLLASGATMLAVAPWLGDDPPVAYLRTMGVVLVAFAAFAVTVPVLHWSDRDVLAVALGANDAVRYCPFCGRAVMGEPGVAVACGRCRANFVVSCKTSLLGKEVISRAHRDAHP